MIDWSPQILTSATRRMKRLKHAIGSVVKEIFQLSSLEMQRLQSLVGFVGGKTSRNEVVELIRALSPRVCPGMELLRFGSQNDGGYLIPNDFDGLAACFSPGVSDVSDFEFECAEKGLQVFLADASVEGPAISHPNFKFKKVFVGSSSDECTTTIEKWLSESGLDDTSDLMLQMDIEGAEYSTLLAVPQSLMSRFRIIVIEFHDLDHLWCKPFFNVASAAIKKLLVTHTCNHIHPNNVVQPLRKHGIAMPPICEFTFTRNDRMIGADRASQFPHPLDSKNFPDRQDSILDPIWFAR